MRETISARATPRRQRVPADRPPLVPATAGPRGALTPAAVLRLQRLAGNAATAALLTGPTPAAVQRCGQVPPGQCPCHDKDRHDTTSPGSEVLQRLTAAERAVNLSSATFAGDARLEAAFDNAPAMRSGETGVPVAKCQQGLMADGFAMPKSITPAGPDGVFGGETHRVVSGFQHKYGLSVDGAIGRQTLGKLDELAIARAPQVAAPPGTGFTVAGKFGDAAGQPNKIFFDRGSAVPDAAELSKIPALATPINRALTLRGFASEDETGRPTLVSNRIAFIDTNFAAANHTGVRTADPRPDDGLGQLNYPAIRLVEVVPAGAGSTTPNCQAGAQYDCGPLPNAYSTAADRANTMLTTAIGQLGSPPSPQAATLLVQLFRSIAARDKVRRNLDKIRNELLVLNDPTRHKCSKDTCDGTCSRADAYFDDQTNQMVVCQSFMGMADLDERAGILIHESSHATPGLFTEDVGYSFERMMNFIDTAHALNNADSYLLFVRNLISPGSVPIGPPPGEQDTFTGFASPVTGQQATQERSAERGLAFVANWLIAGDSETSSLYNEIKAARAARRWTDSFYEQLMGFAARRFGLTAPPAVPADTDQHSVAGMSFRYSRLAQAASQPVTVTKAGAGVDTWAPGPGNQISLTEAFFRLTARQQVDTLLTMIIQASSDIEAAHQQPYVVFTEDMRRHVGRPAP